MTKIALIGISDKDMELLGRWPWPRNRYAELIYYLKEGGAGVIAFDMFFDLPDIEHIKNDIALSEAASDAGTIIFPVWSPTTNLFRTKPEAGIYRGRINKNIDIIANSAKRIGHLNVFYDSDGVARSTPIQIAAIGGNESFIPLSLALFLEHKGIDQKLELYPGDSLIIGNLHIPLDSKSCIPINYIDFEKQVNVYQGTNIKWIEKLGQEKPITLYSFYDVLSADAYTKHGFNIHGCIFDELHAQPKRDLWDVLTEGAGDAREQPLTFAITTAGYDRNSICWEVHEQAMDIKNGVYENEHFLPIIYALDEKDDWKDEANWYKVNPSLDVIIDIEKVRTAFREAEHIPAKQNTFKRLRLCQWTQQSDRFIDMNLWDSQAGTPIDETELIGRQGCGGLDLASVSDLTAWVMIFKQEYTDTIDILCRFWCNKARIYADDNKYKDRYQSWERDGYLITTPGNAIDYQFIRAQVVADCKKFNIVAMNVDRLFQGFQLATELTEDLDGITEVTTMGMGHVSYAVPMKDFERNLLEGHLHHGGNPVLRFCADHLAVKMNEPGDYKPDKATSQGKIDGIVALVMAFDQLSRHASDTESVYEKQELFVF